MHILLAVLIGLGVSIITSRPIITLIKEGKLSVLNYRKEEVPIAIGVAIMGSIIVVSVIFHLLNLYTLEYKRLFVYSGVFIIGFVDDVLRDKSNKGFKGHFTAFFRGKLTTGFLKAMGIPLILLFYFNSDNYFIIFDLIFVALTVNLFNFFDLRPGRCQKVFLFSNLMLLIFVGTKISVNLSVIGIVLYTLLLDLREEGVLGDSGANLLGVITGLQLLNLTPRGKILAYGAIGLLTLIGERYSFNKIIEGNTLLNYLDKLGRT